MSAYRRAKLKYNLLSYGGGVLLGMAIMGGIAVGLGLGGLIR